MKRKLFAILFLILFATTCLAQYPHFRSKPPLGTAIDWSHPQVQGLVGWWLFQEGMGDKVCDLSGNGNTGTLNGFAFPATAASGWNPGRIGRTLAYDGSGDYIEIPKYDLIENWTITCWAYGKEVAPGDATGSMLFGNKDDSNNFFYMADAIRARFNNNADVAVGWTADTAFANTWRHAALVADSTGVELYLDGVSQGRQVIVPAFKFYHIGKARSTVALEFNGLIDDVRVYNRALTQPEIQDIYTDGMAMFTMSFWLINLVKSAQVIFFQ